MDFHPFVYRFLDLNGIRLLHMYYHNGHNEKLKAPCSIAFRNFDLGNYTLTTPIDHKLMAYPYTFILLVGETPFKLENVP